MQLQRPAALPGVFYGSDMGVSMDSALALAVLYGASSKVKVIGGEVGHLILGAGDFSGSAVDPRIKADVAAARRVFAEWPTPIVVVGREAGAAVPYPGASIAGDFAWATTHPIVEAYRASKPMPYDVPSQAV